MLLALQITILKAKDLFANTRNHPWIFTGDNETLVVFLQDNTLMIDKHGRYAFVLINQAKRSNPPKPDLRLLLQVLAEQNDLLSVSIKKKTISKKLITTDVTIMNKNTAVKYLRGCFSSKNSNILSTIGM